MRDARGDRCDRFGRRPDPGCVAAALALSAACLLGCRDSRPAPAHPPATSALAPTDARQAPEADAGPADAIGAPPAVDCTGTDRRLYGSTCCDVIGLGKRKVPGQVFLRCRGAQLGQRCQSKTDCDIACSCDPPDTVPKPGSGPRGPADGTPGVSGVCIGRLQIGVWTCQIDEHGLVTHVIVD